MNKSDTNLILHTLFINVKIYSIISDDSSGTDLEAVERELDTRWSCGACTFLNVEALTTCEICSTPKNNNTRPMRQCRKRKMDLASFESDTDVASVSFGFEDSDAAAAAKKRKINGRKDDAMDQSKGDPTIEAKNDLSIEAALDIISSDDNTESFAPSDSENEEHRSNRRLNVSKTHGRVHEISDSEGEMEPLKTENMGNGNNADTASIERKGDIGQEVDKEWSCEACTFLNKATLRFCEMCSTAKPTSKQNDIVKLNAKRDVPEIESDIASVSFGYEQSLGTTCKAKEPPCTFNNSSFGLKEKKKVSCTISKNSENSDFDIDMLHESIGSNSNENAENPTRSSIDKKCRISLFESSDPKSETDKSMHYNDIHSNDTAVNGSKEDLVNDGTTSEQEPTTFSISNSQEVLSLSQSQKTPKTFRFRKTESLGGTPDSLMGTPRQILTTPTNSQGSTSKSDATNNKQYSSSQPKCSSSQEYNLLANRTPLRPIPFSPTRTRTPTPSTSITRTPKNTTDSVFDKSFTSEEHVILQETEAAFLVFSPKKKRPSNELYPWRCPKCDLVNEAENDDCDGCLEGRPTEDVPLGKIYSAWCSL